MDQDKVKRQFFCLAMSEKNTFKSENWDLVKIASMGNNKYIIFFFKDL